MDYKLWFHITFAIWLIVVVILVFGIDKKVWDYFHKDEIEQRKCIANIINASKANRKKKQELLLKFT